MSLVWERAPYTAGSLLVLLALADWANDEGFCWPSIPKIAGKTRLERRSIQYIIRKLQSDGMLHIEEGRGRKHQHQYTINVQNLRLLPNLVKGEIDDVENVQSTTQKAQSATEKVQSVAPDPSVEPLEDPSVEPPSSLDVVFAFYKTHLDHGRTILTDERRKLINRRFREGYSADDLCAAIRGCKLSAFHQGENDRGTIYDSIELIFKDAQHVETFIARAEGRNGNGNGHKPTASDRRVDQLRANAEFLRSGGRSVDS